MPRSKLADTTLENAYIRAWDAIKTLRKGGVRSLTDGELAVITLQLQTASYLVQCVLNESRGINNES